jgi:hypothetical protein
MNNSKKNVLASVQSDSYSNPQGVTTEEDRNSSETREHYLERMREDLERIKTENSVRLKLTKRFSIITVFWILLILMVVIFSGLGVLNLANSVLIALISTTTANVFGFMYVVVKYLFNERKST